ncbi:C_GCAxxG_C_C family protein [Alicyclobacillus sp. SO9]|nr:C_GCAxxG_C_C family protein [Alicyclobacillus sp. SO9]
MLELSQQGLNCSQMIVAMGLETLGQVNPDLVQAMAGLGGGVGFTGKACGAMTGGACLLSLYAAGLTPHDAIDAQLRSMEMAEELVRWFEQQFGQEYGGTNCQQILGAAFEKRTPQPACADIVSNTYSKVQEIAEQHKLDLTGDAHD